MKRIILLTAALLLIAKSNIFSQSLFSHLDGWSGTRYCGTNYLCPSFETLCVPSTTGCSPSDQWHRIGTPNQVNSTEINLVAVPSTSSPSCEGIFTNFNFLLGLTYKIHVGVT